MMNSEFRMNPIPVPSVRSLVYDPHLYSFFFQCSKTPSALKGQNIPTMGAAHRSSPVPHTISPERAKLD